MVLRYALIWLSYTLIALPALGQEFRKNIVAIRPESSSSPVGQLRFYESGTPTNYVGFKAPASIAANVIWELPSADGTSGNCLGWSSAGVIAWVTCSGGGGGAGVISVDGIDGALTFVDDTNVTVTPSGTQLTIGWSGTLAKARQPATNVHTDQSNTYSTGTQSFNSATAVLVPAGAGVAHTAASAVSYNSTSNKLGYGNGSSHKVIATEDGNIATATALAANPTDCGSGEFANAIAANGNLTCAVPVGGGNVSVTGTPVSGNLAPWSGTGGALDPTGVAYSQGNSNSALVQRDSGGNISASNGAFQRVSAHPLANASSGDFYGGPSQTGNIVNIRNDGGTVLSGIDKDGKFTGNAATATALESDPAACTGGQFVTDIAANGTLTCATGSSGYVSSTLSSTADWFPQWNSSGGLQIKAGKEGQTTTPLANAVVTTDQNKAMTVRDKKGQLFNVLAYHSGTINDGSTTAAKTAIQDAINECEGSTYGGIVYLPPGIYAVDGVINIGNGDANTTSTKAPCSLEGAGNGVNGMAGSTWTGATVIKYTGSNPGSTDYVIKMNGPSIGGGISRLTIDLQSNTTPKSNLRGVLIENVSHGRFYDLSIIRYSTIAMVITSRSTDTAISYGACDNKFYGLKVFASATGGSGILLDGNATAGGMDACSNLFQGAMVWHDGATAATYGIKLRFADNNRFYDTNIYSFGGSSAYGVLFERAVQYSTGTVAASSGLAAVTGTGTTWTSAMSGQRMLINGVEYVFTYSSATTGTLSPVAASTFSGLSYTLGSLGFPNENHFYSLSAHSGVYGTTGTGSANAFYNFNAGDCSGNCDPQAAITSGAKVISLGSNRTITGVGAIRQFHDTTGTLQNYYLYGEDVNNTRLYSLKRGAASGNGLEIYSYNDIKFTHPGTTYFVSEDKDQSNAYFTLYDSVGPSAANRYGLHMRRARGTEASPSDAVSGDRAGVVAFWWRSNSGTFYPSAAIGAYADTISGANLTTSIRFGVTNATSFPSDKFIMKGSGAFKYAGSCTAATFPGSPEAGDTIYCSDCNTSCAGGSSGRLAFYNGSAWVCQ